MGRREGFEDLVEDGAGERADGVAAVEKDRLAVGLVEDFQLGSVLLGDADTIHVDPVASVAVGRLGGGDDGSLGQRTRKLHGIDTAVDDGASVAAEASDIQTEGPALDEALGDHVVDDIGVGARPALQGRTSTEDANGSKLAVGSNAKDLLADSGGCVVPVSDCLFILLLLLSSI